MGASDAGKRPSGPAAWIATVGGIGYAPIAPGTFGSLPGLAIAWALWSWSPWAAAPVGLAIGAVGMWAADRTARAVGRSDPGIVVIDETAGQVLALIAVPPGLATYAAGFVLFRLFDIIKPPPVRNLERLHGGIGIVADDLAAGLYAAVTLHFARWLAAALDLGFG